MKITLKKISLFILLPSLSAITLIATSCSGLTNNGNNNKPNNPTNPDQPTEDTTSPAYIENQKLNRWHFYKEKKEIDNLSISEIENNLTQYKTDITNAMQIDTLDKVNMNTDFIKKDVTNAYGTYQTGQYYHPMLNDLTKDAKNDSSVEVFINYYTNIQQMQRDDISFFYLFTHDYFCNTGRYTKLMKLHYSMQKLWELKYSSNFSKKINEYTMSSSINITDLQNDLINWVRNYYSYYMKTPYLDLNVDIKDLSDPQGGTTLHNDLTGQNNDQMLGWIQKGDQWLLRNDPNSLNIFGKDTEWSSTKYIQWELDLLDQINANFISIVSNISKCLQVTWSKKYKVWRVYWLPNSYPKAPDGSILEGKGTTWFGFDDFMNELMYPNL